MIFKKTYDNGLKISVDYFLSTMHTKYFPLILSLYKYHIYTSFVFVLKTISPFHNYRQPNLSFLCIFSENVGTYSFPYLIFILTFSFMIFFFFFFFFLARECMPNRLFSNLFSIQEYFLEDFSCSKNGCISFF